MTNKRGISAIVTTIILVALVLIVVGIFWNSAVNLVEKETEELNYAQQCSGLIFEVKDLSCDGSSECNISIERKTGSKGDPIDGVEITVSDNDNSEISENSGNIGASKSYSVSATFDATTADVRIYLDKEDGSKYYCSQITSYPTA